MREWIAELQTRVTDCIYREGEPLSGYTTFRIGGKAALLAEPAHEEALCALIAFARAERVPCLLIGNGSNLLIPDEGFDGLVILPARLNRIDARQDTLTAQCGAMLGTLTQKALECGLGGLASLTGIPGTVGGAVYMNAGAFGSQISDTVSEVRALCGGEIRTIPVSEARFGYRRSIFASEGMTVLSAVFSLGKDSEESIRRRMGEVMEMRRQKQPLEYPSAGSFFKRPEGHFAGALIEQAGLKGERVGNAAVSEKHAGFLINLGGATCADVLALMRLVQKRVFDMSGVMLEPEVKIIGRENVVF